MSNPPPFEVPAYIPQEPEPAKTGQRRGTVVFVLGILGIVAAAAFALSSFLGGGASSAEDAVDDLLDAIEQEDAIGALEVLAPAERDVLEPGVVDLADELSRLGLTESLDLHDVSGVDLAFDGYQLRSTPLASDVVAVSVEGGTFSASATIDELPISSVARDAMDDEEDPEPTNEDIEDLRLVAVEDDGWYVSLGYTVAEYWRVDAEEPLPPFDGAITGIGADSPTEAVQRLVDTGAAFKFRTAIGMLAPDEMAPLYDYAPLFLDDVQQELDEEPLSVDVEDLTMHEEGDGITRRVVIDGFFVEWVEEDRLTSYRYDGNCLEMSVTYDEDTRSSFSGGAFDEAYCRDGTYRYRYDDDEEWRTGDDGVGFEMPTIAVTVEQIGDRWYVSPTRTLVDTGLDMLRSLDPDEVRRWLEESMQGCFFGCSARFEQVGTSIGGSTPGTVMDPAVMQCMSGGADIYGSAGEAWPDLEESILWNRIGYLQEEATRSCFADLAAQGTISADELDLYTWTDDCYAAYGGLTIDDPEDRWATADPTVTACLDQRYGFEPPTESYGSPRVLQGLVVVPRGDGLLALDPDTSATVWESDLCPNPDWPAPGDGKDTAITVLQCFDTDEPRYVGVDVATGAELWSYVAPEAAERSRIGGGLLVLQSEQILRAIDLATGAERWSYANPEDSNIDMDDTHVYVSNNHDVFAFDSATGAKVWTNDTGASGLHTDGQSVFARLAMPHAVRRLDRDTGVAAWQSNSETSRLDWSDLVASTDTTVIALTRDTEDRLTVFDKATGTKLWQKDAGPDGSMLVTTTSHGVVITDFIESTVTLHDDRTGSIVEVLGEDVTGTASARGDVVAWITYDVDGEQQVVTRRL